LSERFAGIPAFHLPYTLPSSAGCNSFVCHSLVLSEAEGYENCLAAGVFFPFRNHSYTVIPSQQARDLLFFFLPLFTRHSPLSFLTASSTHAPLISRTRSRKAGTSSFFSPFVSMVSCRHTVTFAGHSIQWPVR